MSEQRADAARPTAHALVKAVGDRDRLGVARLLRDADLPALVVVLADMVANPSDSVWLTAFVRDLRHPDLTTAQIAGRYGLTEPQVWNFCRDNHIKRPTRDTDDPIELSGGRWVNFRGVMRWVAGEAA